MKKIEKYAQLVVKIGINVSKGDNVRISSPIENTLFSELLVKQCYLSGANNVLVDYVNDNVTRMKYEYENNFKSIDSYVVAKNDYLVENQYKLISIKATDPELLNGIDQSKISDFQLAYNKSCSNMIKQTMNNDTSWCVISIPTLSWAKRVFPESNDPVACLWDAIFSVSHINEVDPIASFNNHIKKLQKVSDFLNDNNFDMLHFKADNNTDLKIKLVPKHIFTSAQSKNNYDGSLFVANIPTEETFTLPKKDGVDGIVYSTKPLNYNGNLIEDFYFKFENGKVVDFSAKKGYEVLKSILNTDEGSRYIGEVALVDKSSSINQLGLLFYNTLFDENASCHLALGRAYPTSLVHGEMMSDQELEINFANNSAIHVDFMFGHDTMKVTGYKNNVATIIMQDGSFV